MTKSLYLVPLFALGLAVSGAQAAPRDADHHGDAPDPAARAAWHSEMCADRYAGGVSRIAYIETKLALTDSQRPAFDAWKSVILSGAKSRQDACLHQTRDGDGDGAPSILEREQRRQHMLHASVEFLDAELPALTALYQTLTPEQKLVFDGPHHGPHGHDGGGFHHHGHDGDDEGPGHHGHDGEDRGA